MSTQLALPGIEPPPSKDTCAHERTKEVDAPLPHKCQTVCADCGAHIKFGSIDPAKNGNVTDRRNNAKWMQMHRDRAAAAGRRFVCAICKVPENIYPSGFEVHHRVPLGMGGADTFENTTPLCYECHNLITMRTIAAQRMIRRYGQKPGEEERP
jgi:5-methylcytosine-specific restriction endonuclease McrA